MAWPSAPYRRFNRRRRRPNRQGRPRHGPRRRTRSPPSLLLSDHSAHPRRPPRSPRRPQRHRPSPALTRTRSRLSAPTTWTSGSPKPTHSALSPPIGAIAAVIWKTPNKLAHNHAAMRFEFSPAGRPYSLRPVWTAYGRQLEPQIAPTTVVRPTNRPGPRRWAFRHRPCEGEALLFGLDERLGELSTPSISTTPARSSLKPPSTMPKPKPDPS